MNQQTLYGLIAAGIFILMLGAVFYLGFIVGKNSILLQLNDLCTRIQISNLFN